MDETERWAVDCQRQFRDWEMRGQRLHLSPQQQSFHYMQMRIVKNAQIMDEYHAQLQQENLYLQRENHRMQHESGHTQATLCALVLEIRFIAQACDEIASTVQAQAIAHEGELEAKELAHTALQSMHRRDKAAATVSHQRETDRKESEHFEMCRKLASEVTGLKTQLLTHKQEAGAFRHRFNDSVTRESHLKRALSESLKKQNKHVQDLIDLRTRLQEKIHTLTQRLETVEPHDKSDDDCGHMRYMYISGTEESQDWDNFSVQNKYRYLSEMNKHMVTWIEAVGFKPVFEVDGGVLWADMLQLEPDDESIDADAPCTT